MKLLIITQVVDKDDFILGFFHRWIQEFAAHCEMVTVVCLREGKHTLPTNVRVFSLGKERGRVSRLRYAARFLRIIWRERANYTNVFVHMNHEYVLLGGLLWKSLRKPTVLWYVHKSVTWKLRLALPLIFRVATASKESFRLTIAKVVVVGLGIDTKFFAPRDTHISSDTTKLLSVGRLSPTKRHELSIRTLALLGQDTELSIVGAPARGGDEEYEKTLHVYAKELGVIGKVHFLGAQTQTETRDAYRAASVFLHTSMTGSMDKVVLEALATGLPVITTSTIFDSSLPVIRVGATPDELARAVKELYRNPPYPAMLREPVVRLHGIEQCITRILTLYDTK